MWKHKTELDEDKWSVTNVPLGATSLSHVSKQLLRRPDRRPIAKAS